MSEEPTDFRLLYSELRARSKATIAELRRTITKMAEDKGQLLESQTELKIRAREAEMQTKHYKELYEREAKEREKLSDAITKLMS